MERLKKNINFQFSIFAWLLFIPTQLGLHFWPEWSHVMGLRVDYLSPTLYFLDLIWIILIFINYFVGSNPSPRLRNRGAPLDRASLGKIINVRNVLVLLFVIANIFVAGNRWEAGYRWIRIWQWIITFKLILQNKKLFKDMLQKVLPFWIIGESLLGLMQVINGGSLNGIFYWLGERRFSYVSLGVAQISYLGQGLIRAYGTFSHPNSFAGFILVSLILFISISPNPLLTLQRRAGKRGQSTLKIFKWVVVFCGLLGLFLSGSRTVWTILILLFLLQLRKIKLGYVVMGVGLTIMALGLIGNNYRITDFVGGWDSEGTSKRGGLMVASIKMIGDNPLFGVGAGNFLVQLPAYQQNSGVFWLQPVHNIFMLIVVEFGIVGLIILFKFLIFNLKFLINFKFLKKDNFKIIIFGIILVTGMVDHYWLTLPQNWWLLCVICALAL